MNPPTQERHRRYLVHGRLRVPFKGYRRPPAPTNPDDGRYPIGMFGPQHGLTPEQAWVAQQLLNRKRGGLRGPRYAARIAGIISTVKRGAVGNSAWGWSMHGKRGGRAMARHARPKLREISAMGVQARARQRRQQKAKAERARRYAAMTPRQREHDRVRRGSPDAIEDLSEW